MAEIEDKKECNGYTSYCPPAVTPGVAPVASAFPADCNAPTCSLPNTFVTVSEEAEVKLRYGAVTNPLCPPRDQLDWSAVHKQSVPKPMPHSEVHVGWGQFDGTTRFWQNWERVQCNDPLLQDAPPIRVYDQDNWEHILNLETHQDWHAALMVQRNGHTHLINAPQFRALAVKLMRVGLAEGIVPLPQPARFGLGVVRTGADLNNALPTFGLSMTYDGVPIGNALPLVASWDATGEPVSLSFPTTGVPSL